MIVTGYEGEKLKTFLSRLDISTPVEYVDNPLYASTNNIYSLYLAKEHLLQDDTLLFESDLILKTPLLMPCSAIPTPALLSSPNLKAGWTARSSLWMKTTTSGNSFPAANSPTRKDGIF